MSYFEGMLNQVRATARLNEKSFVGVCEELEEQAVEVCKKLCADEQFPSVLRDQVNLIISRYWIGQPRNPNKIEHVAKVMARQTKSSELLEQLKNLFQEVLPQQLSLQSGALTEELLQELGKKTADARRSCE